MKPAQQAGIAPERIRTLELTMDTFPDRRPRTVRVWLPEGYDGKRRFPVLYMHDAQNLFDRSDAKNNRWHVDRELEQLEKEGLPAILVGVDNGPARMSELCPDLPVNPEVCKICNLPPQPIVPEGHLYADFITGQLKPIIDREFATLPDKLHTAIGGSSMGGLMSLYMLLKYPEVYGKALVFSPNLVTHTPETLVHWIESFDFAKLAESRIFVFHGGVGLEAENEPFVWDLVQRIRRHGMDDTHLAFVYDSRQPHYETAWRKYFSEAFRYLFAEDNSEAKYFQ